MAERKYEDDARAKEFTVSVVIKPVYRALNVSGKNGHKASRELSDSVPRRIEAAYSSSL